MRKLRLRDISYHSKNPDGITICSNQNSEPSKHSCGSPFHFLTDGDKGFSQFSEEMDYSDILAVNCLGGEHVI